MNSRLVLVVVMVSLTLAGAEKKEPAQIDLQEFGCFTNLDDICLRSSLMIRPQALSLSSTKILAALLDKIDYSLSQARSGSCFAPLNDKRRRYNERLNQVKTIVRANLKAPACEGKPRISCSLDDLYIGSSLRLHKNLLSVTVTKFTAQGEYDVLYSLHAAKEILKSASIKSYTRI